MRETFCAWMLGASVFVVPACSEDRKDETTVTLGVILPRSGEGATLESTIADPISVAVNEVNKAGGVLGGAIELVFKDSRSDTNGAVQAAQELVDLGVAGIIGAVYSSNTMAAAPVVKEARVPMISGCSGASEISALDDDDFVFRTIPNVATGRVVAQVMRDEGHQTVGIVLLTDGLNLSVAEQFKTAFPELGGDAIASDMIIEYDVPEGGDWSQWDPPDVSALHTADAVYALVGHVDGVELLKSALPDVQSDVWYLGPELVSDSIWENVGGLLDGHRLVFSQIGGPRTEALSDALHASFGLRVEDYEDMDCITAEYDAAAVMTLAIAHAGADEPIEVRDALRTVANHEGTEFGPMQLASALAAVAAGTAINYQGAHNKIELNDAGDSADAPLILGEFDANADFQLIREVSAQVR